MSIFSNKFMERRIIGMPWFPHLIISGSTPFRGSGVEVVIGVIDGVTPVSLSLRVTVMAGVLRNHSKMSLKTPGQCGKMLGAEANRSDLVVVKLGIGKHLTEPSPKGGGGLAWHNVGHGVEKTAVERDWNAGGTAESPTRRPHNVTRGRIIVNEIKRLRDAWGGAGVRVKRRGWCGTLRPTCWGSHR